MSKSYPVRSLSDEIRRYWLVRPPQHRTPSSAEGFSRDMWTFGLRAGSSLDRHDALIMRTIGPLMHFGAEASAGFVAD